MNILSEKLVTYVLTLGWPDERVWIHKTSFDGGPKRFESCYLKVLIIWRGYLNGGKRQMCESWLRLTKSNTAAIITSVGDTTLAQTFLTFYQQTSHFRTCDKLTASPCISN